ncbi:prolactin receptor-like [Myxocyprinus asiaticus]|uniref:prolactin receptor-like n=1 Tax=Myxocyprinus asiaticus TaxID=70543 RepID=UPI0022217B5D|nr:prolactin receptor-like [Myxocyprinus asiaticus]XP_051536786.1 prolactin receptor-like [Myxocyprinus asiaticus]
MMADSGAVLILTFIATLISQAAGVSPPGKPRVTSCRSPEKETFTCWWEPGYDGDLRTTYALYYRLDNSETVYECPDYKTAGDNSCFFSKNDTSLWVNYNITVVATNALGKNISDPVEVDVVYIVQPNTPENVTAVVVHEDRGPFVRVSWEKPRTADTRSGWITLVYQLQVKQEKDKEWEEYDAGMQKYYNVFSLHPGKEYMVQVRCKPDHGFWSEWTQTTYVKMPDYIARERSLLIMVTIFSVFIILVLTWTLNMKRKSVKLCLLPPVPGPKIKGFDKQLLKSGKSEEVFNALVIQGFPPTTDYDNLLVEYLEVYDNEEQELVLDGKDLLEGLKSKSPSDRDSGRGSCDSRTLLLEKCIEGRKLASTDQQQYSQHGETSWPSTVNSESQGPEPSSPESVDKCVKTWPVVFSSPQPQPHQHFQVRAAKPAYSSVPEILSISSPHGTPSNYHQLQHQDIPPQESRFSKPPCRHSQSYSQFNLDSNEHKVETQAISIPPSRSLEYVEVQRVNPENMLLLRPLSNHNRELDSSDCTREDYSNVKEVTSNNMLLLQREMSPQCLDDYSQDLPNQCPTQQQQQLHPCKPAVHQSYSLMPQEGIRLMGNGYVDSTVLMPSY